MDFDIVELLLIKLFLSKDLQKQSSRGVLKICSKFTGEHPCRSIISIMLRSNFIEITLRHRCSVNLMHIFEHLFPGTPLDGCFWIYTGKLETKSKNNVRVITWDITWFSYFQLYRKGKMPCESGFLIEFHNLFRS